MWAEENVGPRENFQTRVVRDMQIYVEDTASKSTVDPRRSERR